MYIDHSELAEEPTADLLMSSVLWRITIKKNYLLRRITILKILEELWKVGIREFSSLADFMLLLWIRFGGNSMNLSHGPPLGSVCSMLHPILLQILLYIEHVTGKFNASEELLEVIVHFDGHPGIIWISNVLLWIKVQ